MILFNGEYYWMTWDIVRPQLSTFSRFWVFKNAWFVSGWKYVPGPYVKTPKAHGLKSLTSILVGG